MNNEPENLKIKYETKTERTTPVNGAFGGMTPDGMLIVSLYFERKSFPETAEIEHIEHNLFGNEKLLSFENDCDIIREIMAKIIITPKVAKHLGHWLIDKANEAEKLQK